MTAIIDDPQLDLELQELYLTGKQWLADLEFLKNEQAFLQDLLLGNAPGFPTAPALRPVLLQKLKAAASMHEILRADISNFMNNLGPLVAHTDRCIHLQLIEDFSLLQAEVNSALSVLKGIKYAIVNARQPV
jgi:hypothetical protein